ncbi:hypothetical protein AB4Z40_27200 [Bosea sp. 2YAB26]|uniref:hypothetical protein n=1 Tax=Bosea sp. 2YAB26 TaxID=3237478 RepID=UPI003F92A9A5
MSRAEFRYAADLRYVDQAYELTVPARRRVSVELAEHLFVPFGEELFLLFLRQ